MRIVIDRKTFADALAEVAPFAPTKTTIEVLKKAKITTKGNRMKIEANDASCALIKYIRTEECDQDGSFLIDIAPLNKFIAKTKGNTIELTLDGNTLKVKHSKGSAEYQTSDANIYPIFAIPDEKITEITLPARMLAECIGNAKGFVSNDQIRPQLCTIYAYTQHGDKFGYCATDTHKLVHGLFGLEQNDYPEVHWLIMPPTFSALTNACKRADDVNIQITESHVQYTIGDIRIQSVQAKGKFPPFERVVPKDFTMECHVDKSELIESIGRLVLFCGDSDCVKFDISRTEMALSVDNLDFMQKSEEHIEHNGCDNEIRIGASASNVLTSVGILGDGEIIMRMTDSTRPIVFTRQDKPNLISLIMPMSLTS